MGPTLSGELNDVGKAKALAPTAEFSPLQSIYSMDIELPSVSLDMMQRIGQDIT